MKPIFYLTGLLMIFCIQISCKKEIPPTKVEIKISGNGSYAIWGQWTKSGQSQNFGTAYLSPNIASGWESSAELSSGDSWVLNAKENGTGGNAHAQIYYNGTLTKEQSANNGGAILMSGSIN